MEQSLDQSDIFEWRNIIEKVDIKTLTVGEVCEACRIYRRHLYYDHSCGNQTKTRCEAMSTRFESQVTQVNSFGRLLCLPSDSGSWYTSSLSLHVAAERYRTFITFNPFQQKYRRSNGVRDH